MLYFNWEKIFSLLFQQPILTGESSCSPKCVLYKPCKNIERAQNVFLNTSVIEIDAIFLPRKKEQR